jgi:hypothetical protein
VTSSRGDDGRSHEALLLAATLGRRAGVDLPQLTADDWTAVADVAAWHGLQPALRHAVEARHATRWLPPTVARRLGDASTVAALRAEARRRQLATLLSALRAAGVDAIVLKGAYLAEHVYPALALRPMSDLDVLVRECHVETALAALAPCGYTPAGPAGRAGGRTLVRSGGGSMALDMHTSINPCAPPFALPLRDVWARASRCAVAGESALALCAEDLLLHLATHMGHGHVLGASMVSLCDVSAWLERFGATADWEAVLCRARDAGARRFVYAALALARRAQGADVPEEVLAALRAPGDDAAVEHALGLLAAPPFVVLGAKAVTAPAVSWRVRAARVARALLVTPARDALGPRLPDRVGGGNGWAVRDGYLARWSAVARLLTSPARGRSAVDRIVGVRALRRWAAEGG